MLWCKFGVRHTWYRVLYEYAVEVQYRGIWSWVAVNSVVVLRIGRAERVPPKVDEIARVCAGADVGHVINNAYGVQCSKTCRLVNR